MKIMFDVRNNELTVYIHTFTAVDNQILTERLHVHSEYDTKWENKLREWSEAKYYKWHNDETMRGHETCITILKFMQVDFVNDFIIDINTYLYKGHTLRKETGVLMINYRDFGIDKEEE